MLPLVNYYDLDNLLMFPDIAAEIRQGRRPENKKTCSMCGDLCATKKGAEVFTDDIKGDKIYP